MIRTAIGPVFVSVSQCPGGRQARLVDAQGRLQWICQHTHEGNGPARTCGDAERARWLREGRAS